MRLLPLLALSVLLALLGNHVRYQSISKLQLHLDRNRFGSLRRTIRRSICDTGMLCPVTASAKRRTPTAADVAARALGILLGQCRSLPV